MSNSPNASPSSLPLSSRQCALLRLIFDLAQAGHRPDLGLLGSSLGQPVAELLADLQILSGLGLLAERRLTLSFVGLTVAVSLPASTLGQLSRAAA